MSLRRHNRTRLFVFSSLLFLAVDASNLWGQADLDVVIVGGRVMDPETGLDAVRDVGIRGESIVEISEQSLLSRLQPNGTSIEAGGHVVAPGFIDLHAHGQSDDAFRYRVQFCRIARRRR